MRALLQRSGKSKVTVGEETVGEIRAGIVVFLGVAAEDEEEDCRYLADKIASLRIFEDEFGKMNLSLEETGGEVLCVSQFTLYGDCRKGRRPNFMAAAKPDKAKYLYEQFCQILVQKGIKVETGVFQAMMKVYIENDGPVTIILESRL